MTVFVVSFTIYTLLIVMVVSLCTGRSARTPDA